MSYSWESHPGRNMSSIGCCAWWSRILLIVFTFPFFVYGIMLMAAAVWVIVSPSTFLEVANHIEEALVMYIFRKSVITQTFGLAVLLLGIAIAVVSFFGYCGSIFRSPLLLKAYILCILMLIIFELLSTLLLMLYWIDPAKQLLKSLQTSLRYSYSPAELTNVATVTWDLLFMAFHCCGVVNSTDFKDTHFTVISRLNFPVTCCRLADIMKLIPSDPECPRIPHEGAWNERGCFDSIGDFISEHIVETSAILLAMLVFQLALIVCSIKLKNTRKTQVDLDMEHL